jgi:diguanylate cyclase (GGDEF)-like protein/PAS domain S-box-containing protein
VNANPKPDVDPAAPGEARIVAPARLAEEARDAALRELQAEVTDLRAQAARFQTAIDRLSCGVCFFDRDGRLIACNRPYTEIYRLTREEAAPGATLREIVERRFRAGTCSGVVEDYVARCASANAGAEPRRWIAALPDGRAIRVQHEPTPDGGWASIHEDVSEAPERRLPIEEKGAVQALIDAVPDTLWVKDARSRFVVANAATARRLRRATPQELIGKSDLDFLPLELAQKYLADERDVIEAGRPIIDSEECVPTGDGGEAWAATTKVPLRNQRGEIVGVIGVQRDVSARRLANALRDGQAGILELIARGAPLSTVFDRLVRLIESQLAGVIGSILLLDEDGRRLRHSAAPSLPDVYCKAVDGVAIGPEAVSIGAAVYRREPVIVADIAADPLWRDRRDLAETHGLRACWSTPILSSHGAALGVLATYARTAREPTEPETRLLNVATQIAGIAVERKLAEDRIHFMATHDALTGLPNRALLRDRLAQAILFARRCERCATVAFIDLDNFKVINDTLGHNCGDELLKAVAERMVECVRVSDTVVRIGGDEFVILFFDQTKGFDETSETLSRIQAAIAAPVSVDGHTLRVTASIGVASFPDDGEDADELLANADAAMYRAKETGRDRVQVYAPGLNEKVGEKFRLREDLNSALTRGEFALLYQPQVNLRAGRVFAVEALIRWRHPTLGVLLPERFIAIAEETGLISPIGEWALTEACRQNRAWQEAGLPPITVAVNVSALQFKEKRFAAIVAAALRDNRLDPNYLELELTESLIMQDVDRAVATMKELQVLGVRLAIDDFGTGYSSLSALKTFPVARLKIDKSFIGRLPNDANDGAVATAVISLGRKLNLKVIAEGVETADQVAFLRQHDCEEMQGYHFSRPVAPAEIERILKAGARLASDRLP